MASTNKTANYELSQYIGTDIPNPLTDYNGDMEKIDTALKANADVAGEAQTGVTGLEAKVGDGTLETEAQNLVGAANELKAGVDSLGSRMSTAELGLNSVNNSLATTNQALTNATNRVSALETHDGIVDGEITSLDGRVSALEQGGGGGGGTITIDTEMSDSSTHAVQNKVIKGYVDNAVSGVQSNVNSVASSVTALSGEVSSLSGDVDDATGEVKRGTIAAGSLSLTLTFTKETIGSNTLIEVLTDPYGILITGVTYTATTVTITINAQPSDVGVSVRVLNI